MDNAILTGDCLAILPALPAGCADLVYADPSFNRGVAYRGYKDRLPRAAYLAWLGRLLGELRRVLAPRGTLFVQIGAEWAGYAQVELDRLGLHRRNTLRWAYEFGPHQRRKFAPSHQPVLYYTSHARRFTFNADAVRVPSARQAKYRDRRANPAGRVPGDVWHFPRVWGTHKERRGHPCQTPEAPVERIIRAASNPGDLVLDPCCGSGTVPAVAKMLRRRWVGIEVGEVTAGQARRRVAGVTLLLPGIAV
jgi:site-specific DNA-methyltransferase (adenine-specific)